MMVNLFALENCKINAAISSGITLSRNNTIAANRNRDRYSLTGNDVVYAKL